MDETTYLLSSDANRQALVLSEKQIQEGNVFEFDIDELNDTDQFLNKVQKIKTNRNT